MFLFLAHLAVAAELTIFTQTPAAVSVDGQLIEYEDASLLLVARNLKGGKHTVTIESIGRKPITQLDVQLRQTERLDLYYSGRTLTRVGSGLSGEAARVKGLSVAGALAGGNFGGDIDGWILVGAGTGPGEVAVVIVDATGNGRDRRSQPPVPPRPPEPPKPEPVPVVFLLTDGFDMSNVYVDGSRVAEFRTNDREKPVTLMSGMHTVEIKSFTEFDTWFKGTLHVSPGEPMRIGYTEDDGVELYNRPGSAWVPK
ncbi:MAG: hypothetical protein EXR71_00930 [Myxococcales bacterium]|nr:hypothetical protein [Myxococcales bacterium]